MSEYMWGAFIVICIIGLSIAGAASILKYHDASKECTQNTDCGSTSYCGSDFQCHAHPTIETTIENTDYTTPALILGISMIIATFIWTRGNNQ